MVVDLKATKKKILKTGSYKEKWMIYAQIFEN